MKTLNNVELGGRNLKVDHALNEKSRLEMICKIGLYLFTICHIVIIRTS